MASIVIDGKKYRIIENLGFTHSVGHYAKAVETDEGERIAVAQPGLPWRFWTARDRIGPGTYAHGQEQAAQENQSNG